MVRAASAGHLPNALGRQCIARQHRWPSARILSCGMAIRCASISTSAPRLSARTFEARCGCIPRHCRTKLPSSITMAFIDGRRSHRARGWKLTLRNHRCGGPAPAIWIRTTATRRSNVHSAAGHGHVRTLVLEQLCYTTLRTATVIRSRSRLLLGPRAPFDPARGHRSHASRQRAGGFHVRSGPTWNVVRASCRHSRTPRSMRVPLFRAVSTVNPSLRCTRAFRSIASVPDGYAHCCPSGCDGSFVDCSLRTSPRHSL